MIPQPLIAVADVVASSSWYQAVLGLTSGHGGAEYEMLLNADGTLVLQLHDIDAHEHSLLGSRPASPTANGALLWFHTTDFDDVVARAQSAGADIAEGPLDNPVAHHREMWVRDPDGYVVVVAGE